MCLHGSKPWKISAGEMVAVYDLRWGCGRFPSWADPKIERRRSASCLTECRVGDKVPGVRRSTRYEMECRIGEGVQDAIRSARCENRQHALRTDQAVTGCSMASGIVFSQICIMSETESSATFWITRRSPSTLPSSKRGTCARRHLFLSDSV